MCPKESDQKVIILDVWSNLPPLHTLEIEHKMATEYRVPGHNVNCVLHSSLVLKPNER